VQTDPLQRFESEYIDYHRISFKRRVDQIKELEALAAHAGKPLTECEASDIKAYLSSLNGLHPNTIRKKLGMIRPFFTWAWDAKLIDAETVMAIQRIDNPRGSSSRGLPRPYKRSDLERMRAQIAKTFPLVDEMWWTRWRRGHSRWRRIRTHAERLQIEAIVALALNCGLRQQEIHRASMDDIHYDNQWVVVRYPKDFEGDADFREVPHTEQSRAAVRAWLECRAELVQNADLIRHVTTPPESPWLMLGRREDRVVEEMTQRHLRDLLYKLGSGWELHRLRHTYGTEMLRSTGRLEIVQKLLGHSTLDQTLGYAKIVRDDLHAVVSKAELEFLEAIGGKEAA
jgi:site-specific recombinase XerD